MLADHTLIPLSFSTCVHWCFPNGDLRLKLSDRSLCSLQVSGPNSSAQYQELEGFKPNLIIPTDSNKDATSSINNDEHSSSTGGTKAIYCPRAGVPNLRYMYPKGYICPSEGVHLRLATKGKNIFTYCLLPNIYTFISEYCFLNSLYAFC